MPRKSDGKTRRQYIIGLGTGAAVAIAGCAGEETSPEPGSDGESTTTGQSDGSDPTEIVFRDRLAIMSQYAEEFNGQQNNIAVDPSMKPITDKYRGLIAEITAGNAPEVVGLDVIFLPKFADLGALADLGPLWEDLEFSDDFFDITRTDFATYNGTQYAFPQWLDLSLVYYNKNHFEEVGLDPENPPTTWSEYREAAEMLTTDDRQGIAATYKTSGQELFTFMPYAWANGGRMLNDDKTESLVHEQETVEALEYLTDLADSGAMGNPISVGWNDIHQLFADEQASMLQTGGYGLGYIRENKPEMAENIGTFMFPKPEGGQHSSFIGGNSVVITSQTKENTEKFEAAKDFVSWMNQEEGMTTTFDLGYFPGRRSGFDLEIAEENAELFEAFQNALEEGHAPPMHPSILELNAELRSGIQDAMLGNKSPQEAMTDASEAMTEILNQ